MAKQRPPSRAYDPRPISAVSSGVGLAGLAGLFAWFAVARHYGMDGPSAAMCGVLACGAPMVLWSLLVDRVHARASTGIEWARPLRPWRETIDVSLAKLAGLWATWGLIAAAYCIGRWYWDGEYLFAMQVLQYAAPFLLLGSIPYILWIDRRLVEPRDGAHAFGMWLIGGEAEDSAARREAIAAHFRSWTVKGFFTAFMISIVPGNWAEVVGAPDAAAILADPVDLARFLIAAMFLVDVAFATVGYLLTMRPLDAHIRSANPYAAGWTAALLCYPPFSMMGDGSMLDYEVGTKDWSWWFADHPTVLALTGAALVVLTGIYAWATVAFGLRFSNLTHRGILTHGPYAWTKHPAYLAKNAFWWLSTLPFLVTTNSFSDMIRNTALLGVISGIYYWRARTEERHLSADPAYREYAEWMERNGPIPRALRWLGGGRKPQPVAAE